MTKHTIQLPFGAVYFRKSNPPRTDWARDYGTAAQDGLNIFRHWFMWGSIETAPGVYDWSDYDRQMDLAAENGIKTIIAELIHAVPDWAMKRYAHAIQVRADGTKLASHMGVSSASGGFSNNGGGAGALTLNCPEVKEAAGRFLTALATRYKDHPAHLRIRRLERVQLRVRRRLQRGDQSSLPALGGEEVRVAEGAGPAVEPLQLQHMGRYRAADADGALSRMHRLAAIPRRQRL